MPLIEAALPDAAQGFADGRIDVEARTDDRLGSIQLTLPRVSLFGLCRDIPRISGIDLATRLRWLFDLLKPRAVAGVANNLNQSFTRSFHRDQSLKQNKS